MTLIMILSCAFTFDLHCRNIIWCEDEHNVTDRMLIFTMLSHRDTHFQSVKNVTVDYELGAKIE